MRKSTATKQEKHPIPIEMGAIKKTAHAIEAQRFVACGAFVFYPLLGIMLRCRWTASYSFVCSSFHILYAYNLEKQINDYMLTNHRLLMSQHVGKKYRVYPNEISFEDKNLWNFYYLTFKDDFKKSKNSSYIELNEENLRYVNEILAYRRNRFKAALSTFMVYKISSYVYRGPSYGFINAFLFSMGLFLQSQQLNDMKFSIDNANHRYFFVDFAGNINFTDNPYGFRKRYLTKSSFDFAERQPLQIASIKSRENDCDLRPKL